MAAYYNEIDKFKAAWLRELMKAGAIAEGEVDERDIRKVEGADLKGFTQKHFFAGVGCWSYALRAAGWADDTAVWTGSCPCQSFSQSGKRGGFGDSRHLWPAWFRLIGELRPGVVFGEQVASKDGLAWLDVVSSDLEGQGYAVGATDLCAAGFGAPHIRQRLWFVAESDGGDARAKGLQRGGEHRQQPKNGRPSSPVADATEQGRDARRAGKAGDVEGATLGDTNQSELGRLCTYGELGDASGPGLEIGPWDQTGPATIRNEGATVAAPSFTNGFWRDAEWLLCRPEPGYPQGRYRAVEPGTFPLAYGAVARVGRLRGYGDAIVAPVAQAFIEAYRDLRKGR